MSFAPFSRFKPKTIALVIVSGVIIIFYFLWYRPMTAKVRIQTGEATISSIKLEGGHKFRNLEDVKKTDGVIINKSQFIIEFVLENGVKAYGSVPEGMNNYTVGQKVTVNYEIRACKPFWERVYVKSFKEVKQ